MFSSHGNGQKVRITPCWGVSNMISVTTSPGLQPWAAAIPMFTASSVFRPSSTRPAMSASHRRTPFSMWTASRRKTGVRANFDTGHIPHVTLQTSYLKQTFDRAIVSGSAQRSNMYNPGLPSRTICGGSAFGPDFPRTPLRLCAFRHAVDAGQPRPADRWRALPEDRFEEFQHHVGRGLVLFERRCHHAARRSRPSSLGDGLAICQLCRRAQHWRHRPAAAINSGETLAPYRTSQMEIGTKIDLGRIAVTVSAFQIEKPSRSWSRREPDCCSHPGGQQRNRGVELNVAGEVRTSCASWAASR